MHMADALVSPIVGVTMSAISTGAVARSCAKIKKDELSEKKLPIMAVSGAFVFAAQMINFTIPATGSSGHIGGGILLAALLGSYPSMLAISAVLTVQCLFFADGGLLALGCNIFNLGVIPCLVIYPLVFRPLMRKEITAKSINIASILAVVISLQLGAFCVVTQTLASGVTELPFGVFAIMMQPIHLAIGLAEGLVTGAVLGFVHKMRPEILTSSNERADIAPSVSTKRILLSLCVLTILTAGGLSLIASENPDGLEWAMEKVAGTSELQSEGVIFDRAAGAVDALAIMPDYNFADAEARDAPAGTIIAGLLGSGLTLILAGAAGLGIKKHKERRAAQKLCS